MDATQGNPFAVKDHRMFAGCSLCLLCAPLNFQKKGLFLEVMCKMMSASRKRGLFLEVKPVNEKKHSIS